MSGIVTFLEKTAWEMQTPEMFGSFHIVMLIAVFLSAAAGGRSMADRVRRSDGGHVTLERLLFAAGCILAAAEAYKQLFIYYIVSGGVYDWWYFPFQLCSVPMYLCLALPFIRGRARSAVLAFLSTFTFVSAAAALIFPEDFLTPYIMLTLHGFVWHGILLYISILTAAAADGHERSFRGAVLLFAALSCAAVCINIACEDVMAEGRTIHDYAAMFYMNPYHISPQPVVNTVQHALGIPAGLILYGLAIIAAAGAIDIVESYINSHHRANDM